MKITKKRCMMNMRRRQGTKFVLKLAVIQEEVRWKLLLLNKLKKNNSLLMRTLGKKRRNEYSLGKIKRFSNISKILFKEINRSMIFPS